MICDRPDGYAAIGFVDGRPAQQSRVIVATTGRGTPVNNRGGWYFPSKLPLLEAETRRKRMPTQASSPSGSSGQCRQTVHNISHDGAETGPIEWHSTFEAHFRRTL
jgi:hypothetical protein